jgi:hypothetical protein
LLTGYVIGKRVDSLEKGLQDLFMSREGVGSDGPPVLQFVWGQRVFGPCVIQNIRVRERSWDTGILVNAEVSFELEQVPEWVINDGFVDIARPGKQSTVNDPTLPGRTEEQPPPGGAGEEEEKKDKPGGGNPTPPVSYDANRCQRAFFYAGLFFSFKSAIDRETSSRNVFNLRRKLNGIFTNFIVKYQDAVQELGTEFGSTSRATEMVSGTNFLLNPEPRSRAIAGYSTVARNTLNSYVSEAIESAEKIYKNPTKCPNTATSGSNSRTTRPSTRLASPTNL